MLARLRGRLNARSAQECAAPRHFGRVSRTWRFASVTCILAVAAAQSCAPASTPPATVGTWSLNKYAEFGGADDGAASLSIVLDFQIAADSSVWVLDGPTQSLRRFRSVGDTGRFVATSGRGPGELGMANGFRLGPRNEMWVRDFGNQRLNRYAVTGEFVGQNSLPPHSYEYRWNASVDDQGLITDVLFVPDADSSKRAIVTFALDAAVADTFPFPPGCPNQTLGAQSIPGRAGGFVGLPFSTSALIHLDRDGVLWCARNDAYEILGFARGRPSPLTRITADSGRLPVSATERDSAIKSFRTEMNQIGGAAIQWDEELVPRFRPALRGMTRDEDGRLWVLREISGRDFVLDVWDASGSRVAIIAVPSALRPTPLIRVRHNRVAMVARDADGVPTIAVFSILAPRDSTSPPS